MFAMARRNIKMYFRDKSAVFFSLLSVFIIIGVYALFLGNTITSNYKEIKGVDFLINSWIMAGILCVTPVTTTLAAFEAMVKDRTDKIIKDFYSSPLKRWKFAGGYIISSFVIGIIMSFLTLLLAEIYLVSLGGEWLTAIHFIKLSGIIVLSVITSSTMSLFLVTFFKSTNAFATASTVVGTLIGFLTGVYVPIGVLPESVQFLVKLFPISYSGVLMRQVLMEQPTAVSFANAPAEMVKEFQLNMSVIFEFNGTTVSTTACITVLAVSALLFFGLSVINLSRKAKE